MNGLMHPEDMIEYARRHHEDLLRLVEIEAMLKPRQAKRPGYREGLMLRLRGFLIYIGLQARPKDMEFDSSSTCDEACVCVV